MKQKHYLKHAIIITSIIAVIFIIRSRIYHREAFDMIVLMRMNEFRDNCNKTDKQKSDYISRFGDCNKSNEELKKIIEIDFEKSLHDEGKFVY
jgi:hypothetical protein